MDIALCAFNPVTLELQYAGANIPLYFISDGELNEIRADNQPIGKYDESEKFSNHTIQLKKGDNLFILTDGFADQFGGANGKKFKYKPLKELLVQISSFSTEVQKEKLETALENWKKNVDQVDDISVIGLKI
jgi:serine phosphatase RsbU (regulator of sigma subunit)